MSEAAEVLAGKFIVIDGSDGCGKSTQVGLLGDKLRAERMRVCQVRDPGGTKIGDRIRSLLLDASYKMMAATTETMLFMASRAQLVSEVIAPALRRGECVLCDRFISATVAYQGAGGVDVEAVRTVGKIAVGGIPVDLTIILDLPVEEGLRRVGKILDRMERKDPEFHRRVREMFLQQAREAPNRFTVIDATGTPEEVHQRIWDLIEHREW